MEKSKVYIIVGYGNTVAFTNLKKAHAAYCSMLLSLGFKDASPLSYSGLASHIKKNSYYAFGFKEGNCYRLSRIELN